MINYIIKRILSLIPVLLVVSIVIFSLIHLIPGDPTATILADEATPEQVHELRESMDLNKPIYVQYFNWMLSAVQGDLGKSYFMNEPVTQTIGDHLKPSISFAFLSLSVAILIAIPIGVISANYRGKFIDQVVMGIAFLGMAIPGFLLGLLLVLLFGVNLGWLPVAGYNPLSEGLWNHLKYLILPAISAGSILVALIARMTRNSMLEVLNENYIKTARAKGVKGRVVIFKHALRNAFLPVLTVIGQSFGVLVGGTVVIETIFGIPGIGMLIVNSVERRDYFVIQGIVLMITFAYILINLLIDLLYGFIDPRVRLDKS